MFFILTDVVFYKWMGHELSMQVVRVCFTCAHKSICMLSQHVRWPGWLAHQRPRTDGRTGRVHHHRHRSGRPFCWLPVLPLWRWRHPYLPQTADTLFFFSTITINFVWWQYCLFMRFYSALAWLCRSKFQVLPKLSPQVLSLQHHWK